MGIKLKGRRQKLTTKQKKFADAILEGEKGNAAIVKAGYDVANDATARSLASENLTKHNIMAYLEDNAVEAEHTLKRVMDYSSVRMTDQIGGAAFAGVAVTAAKDILDRVHGKPTQRVESSSKLVSISIDLSAGPDDQQPSK